MGFRRFSRLTGGTYQWAQPDPTVVYHDFREEWARLGPPPFQVGDRMVNTSPFTSAVGARWYPSWDRPLAYRGSDPCPGCLGRGFIIGPVEGLFDNSVSPYKVVEQRCRYCKGTGRLRYTPGRTDYHETEKQKRQREWQERYDEKYNRRHNSTGYNGGWR